MKNIAFCLLGLLTRICILGQTPNSFKYQAVVRDNTGNLIINEEIELEISILQGSITGVPIFTETHYII